MTSTGVPRVTGPPENMHCINPIGQASLGVPLDPPHQCFERATPYEHVKARLGLPVDDAEAEEVPVVGVGLLPGSPFVNAWSKIIDALREREEGDERMRDLPSNLVEVGRAKRGWTRKGGGRQNDSLAQQRGGTALGAVPYERD